MQKHRDTEKAEGMFGTLVIQLPSNYTGGKLIVYHQGKKSEFNYSGPDCYSNFFFTSFYADCQHEVKKVTEGYRLCLIYNLIYQGIGECPAPADNQKQVTAIVSAMKKWGEDIDSDDCPDMMTYLLEHQYCEASLSFHLLKNCDRAVGDVLAQAKTEVDFDFYVGQVNLTEHWSAEHCGYGDYEAIECCDESVHVEHLEACIGEGNLSRVEIYKESFVPDDFFDTIDPDDEEFEEATGNEGATVDKQYNWAALLLWPIRKRTAVMGVSNMTRLFKQDVDAGRKDLGDVAKDIIREMRHNGPSVESCLTFLHSLLVLGDKKLIADMLGVIAGIKGSYGYSSGFIDEAFATSVMSIAHKHGWDIIKAPLQTMFTRCSSSDVEKYCTFLKRMIISKKPDDDKDLYKNLLSNIVKVLTEEADATPNRSSSSWMYGSYKPPKVYRSKEFVIQLFDLLTAVGSDDLFASANSALRNKPVRYPILETLGPAIVDFCKSTKVEGPLQVILTYCVSQLEVSLRRVVPAPTSNAKPVKFSCSCKDCIELMHFLQHPRESQYRFKIPQKRRQHLEQQLGRSGVDATHKTEAVGSPHTLVVTKNHSTYEKIIKKQQRQRALLVSLQPLMSANSCNIPSENEPPVKKQKSTTNVSSSYVDLT